MVIICVTGFLQNSCANLAHFRAPWVTPRFLTKNGDFRGAASGTLSWHFGNFSPSLRSPIIEAYEMMIPSIKSETLADCAEHLGKRVLYFFNYSHYHLHCTDLYMSPRSPVPS